MPSCHSTNDYLNQLISNKVIEEGTTVVTSDQTKGRGQRGNAWECQADSNITLSCFLQPHFIEAKDQFTMNIAVSLGVYDTITSLYSSNVKIKWPNDILIDNKKICGILIENYLSGRKISNSIVGIGLNINQTSFNGNFPATSLFIETGKKMNLNYASQLLLENLDKRYHQLKNGEIDRLKREYYDNMFWFQEEGLFEEVNPDGTRERFNGVILGVNDYGCISIAKENKEVKHYAFKEVKHIY